MEISHFNDNNLETKTKKKIKKNRKWISLSF